MNKIFVNFFKKPEDGPSPEKVSSVFLIAFIEGKMVVSRNERGWDILGGHVEASDTDLLAAVRRESKEEGGLAFTEAVPFAYSWTEDPEYKDKVMLYYVTDTCELGEFIPAEDVFERAVMALNEFLAAYQGDKAVMADIVRHAQEALQ